MMKLTIQTNKLACKQIKIHFLSIMITYIKQFYKWSSIYLPTKEIDKTNSVTTENNLYSAPNYKIPYKLTPEEDWTNATVLSRAGKQSLI